MTVMPQLRSKIELASYRIVVCLLLGSLTALSASYSSAYPEYGIFKSTDGGDSWKKVSQEPHQNSIVQISGSTSAELYDSSNLNSDSLGDYSGDGLTDLLLQSDQRSWWLYTLDRNEVLTSSSVSLTRSAEWHPKAFEDFDGDGDLDALFRSDAGAWWLYTFEAGKVQRSARVSMSSDTAWQPQAYADFNGDGSTDVLLRNTNGSWWLYGLNGTSIVYQGSVSATRDTDWKLRSAEDLDGDGKADMLIFHEDIGWWVYTLSANAVETSGALRATRDPNWALLTVSDFDGDGRSDLLMRNQTTNGWYLYTLNGHNILSAGSVAATSSGDWQPVSYADLNGDGRSDLLIRKDTGSFYVYFLNGNQVLSKGSIGLTSDLNWSIVGAGNFDNAGGMDLLFRNANGAWWLYRLNGRTIVASGSISATRDLTWSPATPQTAQGEQPPEDAAAFFQDNLAQDVIAAKCRACHVSGGVAGHTPLVYGQNDADNYEVLKNYLDSDSSRSTLILDKVRGVSHGGGLQLSSNSAGYNSLVTFIDLLGVSSSTGSGDGDQSPVGQGYWSGVTMLSRTQTLRRASLLMAGSLPPDSAVAAVENGDEDTLRQTLRTLLEGDGFHEFLLRAANDRLLTDAFVERLFFDAADPYNQRFPEYTNWWFNHQYGAEERGEQPDWALRQSMERGLARAPLELIAYVVQNDRSYQEVVTADYTMLNFRTNELLRGGLNFDTQDPLVFKPGKNRGQIIHDDQLQTSQLSGSMGSYPIVDSHSGYIDYPHAGILNSHAFLNRYPTTETNRNRARARWTFYHFLGIDIEKSASRTTDPEALADTNNPTMNNSACTVCHSRLDPVAGSFQDYGNEGIYRDKYGGRDSLPETYKYPERSDESAEPSPYVEGDTWFRDMREPGLEQASVPAGADSMQWLGQQIAADPRFASAAVKFWWPALMGSEALEAPEVSSDSGFQTRQAAFEQQNADIEKLGADFSAGISGGEPFNGKDLLVELALSPWFRATAVEDNTTSARLVPEAGTRRLLGPEELERKTIATVGYGWDKRPDQYQIDGYWSSLRDKYKIYYGGIDSLGITKRNDALTSIMINVADMQAVELSCPVVLLDFDKPVSQRKLFNKLDPNITPATELLGQEMIAAGTYAARSVYTVAGNLSEGEKQVRLYIENGEWLQSAGEHRSVNLDQMVVKRDGNTIATVEFENLVFIEGSKVSCANEAWNETTEKHDSMRLNGCGEIIFPYIVGVEGSYTFEFTAWGLTLESEAPILSISVESATPEDGSSLGAELIKQQLVDLHYKFLGERHATTSEDIEMAYELVVDTWQERKSFAESWGNDSWRWRVERCDFWRVGIQEDVWAPGGIAQRQGSDPTSMKATWMSVIYYLMTDFAYLHE